MEQDNIFITQEKFTALEQELEKLIHAGRSEMAERLDSAKALGDLKENAEYHQSREDQAIMEERISHIQNILKHGQIIKAGKHSVVEIGATVSIAKKGSSTKQEYSIVGPEEADPSLGKLSFNSPLVVAMMNKKEGDFFNFVTPGGESVEWKVAEVK